MSLLPSPATFPSRPHAAAGMRWFRHFTAFLWHTAILALSLAAKYQADNFTVDRAFTESFRRKRSHFCTSMGEQPNGETKPNYPAQRENVKDQLDRTYQESPAPFGAPLSVEVHYLSCGDVVGWATAAKRSGQGRWQPASWRLAECGGRND